MYCRTDIISLLPPRLSRRMMVKIAGRRACTPKHKKKTEINNAAFTTSSVLCCLSRRAFSNQQDLRIGTYISYSTHEAAAAAPSLDPNKEKRKCKNPQETTPPSPALNAHVSQVTPCVADFATFEAWRRGGGEHCGTSPRFQCKPISKKSQIQPYTHKKRTTH